MLTWPNQSTTLVPAVEDPSTKESASKHAVRFTSPVGTVECATGITSKGSFTTSDAGTLAATFTGCAGESTFTGFKLKGKCKAGTEPSGTIGLLFEVSLVTYLQEGTLALGIVTPMFLETAIIVHCEMFNLEFSGALMGQVAGIATGKKVNTGEFNFRINKEGKQELKECDLLEAVCFKTKSHKKILLFARFFENEGHNELATELVEDKASFAKEFEVLY